MKKQITKELEKQKLTILKKRAASLPSFHSFFEKTLQVREIRRWHERSQVGLIFFIIFLLLTFPCLIIWHLCMFTFFRWVFGIITIIGSTFSVLGIMCWFVCWFFEMSITWGYLTDLASMNPIILMKKLFSYDKQRKMFQREFAKDEVKWDDVIRLEGVVSELEALNKMFSSTFEIFKAVAITNGDEPLRRHKDRSRIK